jgi:flavin-dependent dehydrogenase
MWQRLDEIERRGPAYRPGEAFHFGQPNKNPNIVKRNVLIVGGGPIGIRCAIEMRLAGHNVTLFEKRRERRDEDGNLTTLGFTNRINRPHMWNFVRNDLAKLNGRDFLSVQAAYPVFTEPETSSIGIDEIQLLLMKNALLLGVDFRLGVGYTDAKVISDPQTAWPRGTVTCTYDKEAAAYFKMEEGKNTQVFDILVGCDGPRSTVRETQGKHFGNIEKRKFKDCVGIVVNVQKVPKKRLRELGFPHGQEPSDMNRTKMAFKDFFKKLNSEAKADVESLIYYKASFHNYVIITPTRDNLVQHGLSGKVYTLGVGRDNISKEKLEEKDKLRRYVAGVVKAAGIPLDETLPNGGFVKAPNDCMSFDFAECWNTPKNFAFNLPPPDYDTDQHGEWEGSRLVAPVCLCGDALLEPFWPLGLGLKRGWQALMDTCWAVDNLCNRTLLAERAGRDPNTFSWDDHYNALKEQIATNFSYCAAVRVSEELGKGEYSDKGMVVTQLKKKMKDFEKPVFEVEVDPWTRYGPLEQEQLAKWRAMPRQQQETWMHPVAVKALARWEYYQENLKGASSSGAIDYTPRKLISIDGKTIGKKAPAGGGGYNFTARKSLTKQDLEPAVSKPQVNVEEIEKKASVKRASLTEKVMCAHVGGAGDSMAASSRKAALADMLASHGGAMMLPAKNQPPRHMADLGSQSQDAMDQLAHTMPSRDGLEAAGEAMWDRMQEKHLSPAQEAELAHVRKMIVDLTKSLETYVKVEKDLMMGS